MNAPMPVPVAGWAGVVVGVFWVGIAVGLVLAVVWRRVEDLGLQRRLQWAAALLFFVPQLPVLLAWNAAAPLVTLQRALLAAWLLVSAAVPVAARRRRTDVSRRSHVGTTLVAVGMAVGAVALGSGALRNLTSPPVPVAGQVQQVTAGYRTEAPVLEVGGQRVRVTRDLARHLRDGMTIEGRALPGTRHLIHVVVIDRS